MAKTLVTNGALIVELEDVVDTYASIKYHLGLASTEYPVESGKMLADNAYRRRERIVVEAVAGNVTTVNRSALADNPGTLPTGQRYRARDCMSVLRRMHRDRELVTIRTLKGTFSNMLLSEVKVEETAERGNTTAVFSLTFEELLAAEVKTLGAEEGQLGGPADGLLTPVQRGLVGTDRLFGEQRDLLITNPIEKGLSGADTPDGGKWDAVRDAVRDALGYAARSTLAGITVQRIAMADTPAQVFNAVMGLEHVAVKSWFRPQPSGGTWFLTLRNHITQKPFASGLALTQQGRPLRDLFLNPIGGELVVAGNGLLGANAWRKGGNELVYVGRGT